MTPLGNIDPMWWISAVELPVFGGLFWMTHRFRREASGTIDTLELRVERQVERFRDGLAAFKLEVAKGYASIAYLKDVEKRLTVHLIRIEKKLDDVSLWGAA